ncbi:hypothetical protein [Azospirillum sp.]|uniref:hypothetical protein n=1 Tax=Azospirillum sp. TaxID=34012 RepID=UPI003D71A0FC
MTVSNTATVKVAVKSTMVNSGTLSTATAPLDFSASYTLANGTAADQANHFFAATYTGVDSTGNSHDLAGGLTDAFGSTTTFTAIKTLVVKAASTNSGNVIVGGAASNAFASMFGDATDKVALKPGGILVLHDPSAAGYAVTAGTGDLLKIAASSGTVDYDLVLIGEA